MPRCYVCGKVQSPNSNPEVSFHRFPSNESARHVWLEAIGCKDCIVSNGTRICSSHFSNTCFYYPKGGTGKQKRLKANSVPMIFQEMSKPIQLQEITNQFETNHNSDMSDDNVQQLKIVEHNEESMEIFKHIDVEPSDTNIMSNQSQTTIREQLGSLNDFQLMKYNGPSVITDVQPNTSSSTSVEDTVVSNIGSITACNSINKDEGTVSLNIQSETPHRKWTRTYNPRYIGDCNLHDFESPRRAQRNWLLAKKYVEIQRKKLKTTKEHNRRLRKKVTDLKSLLANLKKNNLISDNASEVLSMSVSDVLKELLRRQLRSKKGPYSEVLRTFPCTLHFYSAKAYNYVRRTFHNNLSNEDTMRRWHTNINGSPGITKHAINTLKLRSVKPVLKIKLYTSAF